MKFAIIPGDGIGKEVTSEAVKVLTRVGDVFGRRFEFDHLPWGADYFLETGVTIPPNGYAMLRDDFDAIFIGALGDPRVPDNRHARDILLGTRFELDLYVNYRPVKLLDERLCPLKNRGPEEVNFAVFRENTEGLYVSVGGRFKAGTEDEVAIQEELNTWKGVNRIVRYAFEFADGRGLRKVCMADKSNAMQQGHALWQRVFKQVATEHPGDPLLHRRARNVHGSRPIAVRGHRHQQSVRRHRDRPGRHVSGRAGDGGVWQYSSRQDVDVRAGAWLRAEIRGKEPRQPDWRDLVGGVDAGNAGAHGGSLGNRCGGTESGAGEAGDR
jgi:isocitrate/isopropylmalate dehydrogenase